GTGGGGGDVGGLPVTGPQARLIGGIGVSVLLAGAVLMLVARRRRVVLVAPQDEQPAA
ncbi:cell wall anchor protein, partial [Micromonospora sp. WP24]